MLGPPTDSSPPRSRVVFLLDVDNTLLDNERVNADLRLYLELEMGNEGQDRYWAIFEAQRARIGYADYLGALQRYRVENPYDQRDRAAVGRDLRIRGGRNAQAVGRLEAGGERRAGHEEGEEDER